MKQLVEKWKAEALRLSSLGKGFASAERFGEACVFRQCAKELDEKLSERVLYIEDDTSEKKFGPMVAKKPEGEIPNDLQAAIMEMIKAQYALVNSFGPLHAILHDGCAGGSYMVVPKGRERLLQLLAEADQNIYNAGGCTGKLIQLANLQHPKQSIA